VLNAENSFTNTLEHEHTAHTSVVRYVVYDNIIIFVNVKTF